MAGVTETGFAAKTLDDALGELHARLRAEFGEGIRLDPYALFGRLAGIIAEREAEQWELAQALYSALDLDQAQDKALDGLARFFDLARKIATHSTAPITVTGDPTTVIAAGSQIAHQSTSSLWKTTADITIGSGGTATGEVQALAHGPVPAPSGTLTRIVTPRSGWVSVTNTEDATLGRYEERDPELRARIVSSRLALGRSTYPAMRAHIGDLLGVSDVIIAENEGDTTDAEGRPMRSYEIIVDGGDDQAIADTIWQNKPLGSRIVHSTTALSQGLDRTISVTDSEGDTHAIRFSRPEQLSVYIRIDATPRPGFSGAEAAAFKAELAEWFNAEHGLGDNIIHHRILCEVDRMIEAWERPRLEDLTVLIRVSGGSWTEDNIPVGLVQRAVLSSGSIAILEAI